MPDCEAADSDPLRSFRGSYFYELPHMRLSYLFVSGLAVASACFAALAFLEGLRPHDSGIFSAALVGICLWVILRRSGHKRYSLKIDEKGLAIPTIGLAIQASEIEPGSARDYVHRGYRFLSFRSRSRRYDLVFGCFYWSGREIKVVLEKVSQS